MADSGLSDSDFYGSDSSDEDLGIWTQISR